MSDQQKQQDDKAELVGIAAAGGLAILCVLAAALAGKAGPPKRRAEPKPDCIDRLTEWLG